MNINELGEDLEQQFGKPRNITEENVRFMLSLIKEEFAVQKDYLPTHYLHILDSYKLSKLGGFEKSNRL